MDYPKHPSFISSARLNTDRKSKLETKGDKSVWAQTTKNLYTRVDRVK